MGPLILLCNLIEFNKNFVSQKIFNIAESSTYVCFANSTFGEVKLVFHINVHKAPRLNSGDDVLLRVKLNHGFSLDCQVFGEPEPNVTWYFVSCLSYNII